MRALARIALSAALACGAMEAAGAAAAQERAAAVQATVDENGGTLADGTVWLVRKPANWNGAVVLDLDGASNLGAPDAQPPRGARPFVEWLLAQGYAYGGITREPIGYDYPQAVEHLLEVRRQAAERWGVPRQTLVTGNSRGAFVVRKALELHPDVFDGGLMSSGGGAGQIAVLNRKLHSLFVLTTLVEPDPPLQLVNVTDQQAEIAALAEMVGEIRATPEGRARLALAAAVEQYPLWASRSEPRPAPDDYEAAVDQIAASFVFATAVPVRVGVERVSGGNVSWNHGTDYAELLDRSGRRPMVEALYARAGLDLAADLAKLAEAPRIAADPAAVRRMEPLTTYTGRIEDPVINVDNDDPVDPASDKLLYMDLLQRAGTDHLARLIWSDVPGHGSQTDLDRAVAFRLLERRIAMGEWDDTSVVSLNALAAETAAASPVDLGRPTFFDPGPLPQPVSKWDVSDWGTYAPPAAPE